MNPSIKGAAIAELIVVGYGLAFFFWFGLGPTPRDYASAWSFAGRAALTALVLGTVLAAPMGAIVGRFAAAVTRNRLPLVVTASVIAAAAVPAIASVLFPQSDLFALAAPGIALAACGGVALERWTRAAD